MFESNFPIDKGTCSYQVLWNAFKRIAGRSSGSQRSAPICLIEQSLQAHILGECAASIQPADQDRRRQGRSKRRAMCAEVGIRQPAAARWGA
jgi:hypothetical protein